jgi:ergothioneine biosynthesis protein EgtB
VTGYRAHVDEALERLAERGFEPGTTLYRLIETGINHEQQHQELLLTDILALFAANPLRPAYLESAREPAASGPEPMRWIDHRGGIRRVGYNGQGFAWDNEGPEHDALVHPFRLADRLVTNAEWLEFMADGGYRSAALWLADGWATVNREQWQSPLYWEERDGGWHRMTLNGLLPVEAAAPVSHVSYFEADAFARWAGTRLPTEFEWEVAARSQPVEGNTLGSKALCPLPASAGAGRHPRQMFGDVWEWTQSAYAPYPGYRPPAGAIGEYNGKFMVSQQVLRGASCVTPDGHSRASYRNFFYPAQRWQFFGLRLASEGVR